MLDAFKNLGNLGSLMTKAKEMQDKFRTLQEELAKKTVTADAAGGMVQATVNGRLELIKLRIDKARIDVERMLGESGRVLLRPSGTEPLLRVMVEGKDGAQVERLARELADNVGKALS